MRFLAIITPLMAAIIVAQPVAQPVDQPVEQSVDQPVDEAAIQAITQPLEVLLPPFSIGEGAAKLRVIKRIEADVIETLKYANVGTLKERVRKIALAKCEIARAKVGGGLKFQEYCYRRVYPATLEQIERRSRFNAFEAVSTEPTEHV
ncbi:hypothetical protein SCUP234_01082 [Seiridium cupressi]